MSENKLKFGIVGFGKMGMLHSAIYNSLKESTVVAVADPSDFPLETISSINKNIKKFKNIEEMSANTELDAIAIASPVSFHIPQAIFAIDNNIPFFLEKPLSLTAEQAKPLISRLQEKPIANMLGYNPRFIDSFDKGKELLESGCLGKLLRISATMYVSQLFNKGKGWRYDKEQSGGGVLIGLASHLIYLLTWYFGKVRFVNCDLLSNYTQNIEDFAHLFLHFDSGMKAWMDTSWSVRFKRKPEIKIEILGENGQLTVSDDTVMLYLDNNFKRHNQGKTILKAPDLYRNVPVDIAGADYSRQALAFIDSIKNGKSNSPTILEGYHVQQIIDAAYFSASDNSNTKEIEI